MEIDSELLRFSAANVRIAAFGLLVLYLMNNKKVWCINLCWRLYVATSLTLAVATAVGGYRGSWDLFSPLLDLACAYFWCKKWEQSREAGTQ